MTLKWKKKMTKASVWFVLILILRACPEKYGYNAFVANFGPMKHAHQDFLHICVTTVTQTIQHKNQHPITKIQV